MTFDFSQEYRRAAHILRGTQNSKAVFLRCYALYLAGEKRKEEERIELSGTLGKAETTNKVTARLLLSTTAEAVEISCLDNEQIMAVDGVDAHAGCSSCGGGVAGCNSEAPGRLLLVPAGHCSV